MLSVSVTQQQTHYHSRKHGFYEYFKYEMEHYVKNKIILASECLKEDSRIMPAPHGTQPVSKLCWNIFFMLEYFCMYAEHVKYALIELLS